MSLRPQGNARVELVHELRIMRFLGIPSLLPTLYCIPHPHYSTKIDKAKQMLKVRQNHKQVSISNRQPTNLSTYNTIQLVLRS
jgi:hypothetical protein